MAIQVVGQSTVESSHEVPEARQPPQTRRLLFRVTPYVLAWMVLLVPTFRTMSRGWRPFGDDAVIAVRAWSTFTLHFPVVGLGTNATTGVSAAARPANPGPLELWLLGPFVRLDPGQGALLGAALLCAVALSIAIYVLQKTAGPWGAVIFALVVADLAIVSPTPFLDPLWNSSFAFFWFLSFMAVAFAVGMGNLKYLALLVFLASVTVDSHLLFFPSTVCVFIAATVLAWFFGRPRDYRWLWWTGSVALVCWFAPVIQQIFGAHGNLSLLAHSGGVGTADNTKTFGIVFGLRALSRAASPSAIWASARPIAAFDSSNDINHRNLFLCLVLLGVAAIATIAWRRRKAALASLSLLTVGAAVGMVLMYSRIPISYFEAFAWVNLAVWVVGICIWLTLGLAAYEALRSRLPRVRSAHVGQRAVAVVSIGALSVAALAATLVVTFPYGNQFLLDFQANQRDILMASAVERQIHPGPVSIGIRYTGSDYYQVSGDEHGVAYLLETAGWVPGLQPFEDVQLGLPIRLHSPFVVFDERGATFTGLQVYPRYEPLELFSPSPTPQTKSSSKG